MNAILTIRPYRLHGAWVFDDPAVGLVCEPFVAGIPEMIDRMVGEIPGAERGFRLLFSSGEFPGAGVVLRRLHEEADGNWYRWDEQGMEGWLCPALFKYFEAAPDRLFLRAEREADVDSAIAVPRSEVERLLEFLEAGDVNGAKSLVAAVLVR